MTASISRILLPTRFAELSRRAAAYVKLLVPALDAELHVVHVVPHTKLVAATGPVMPMPGPPREELLDNARCMLASFVREVIPELAGRTRIFATIGGVTDELIRHAGDHEIDLVIMGTHAEGMLKRLVFGSVGKGVLEGAPCPVLLVPVRDESH